ncbi:MAG: hypothetical protein ABIZ34_04675 [Candidatus Limnocylindrales bacterium]
MKRILHVLVGMALGSALVGGVALAANNIAPAAAVTAEAPNARLAVLIDGGATAPGFTVLRRKGVASVSNPSTGIFCITPKASLGMDVSRIMPIVTTELMGTALTSYRTLWDATGFGCPAGSIAIEGATSGNILTNDVGIALVVP